MNGGSFIVLSTIDINSTNQFCLLEVIAGLKIHNGYYIKAEMGIPAFDDDMLALSIGDDPQHFLESLFDNRYFDEQQRITKYVWLIILYNYNNRIDIKNANNDNIMLLSPDTGRGHPDPFLRVLYVDPSSNGYVFLSEGGLKYMTEIEVQMEDETEGLHYIQGTASGSNEQGKLVNHRIEMFKIPFENLIQGIWPKKLSGIKCLQYYSDIQKLIY